MRRACFTHAKNPRYLFIENDFGTFDDVVSRDIGTGLRGQRVILTGPVDQITGLRALLEAFANYLYVRELTV